MFSATRPGHCQKRRRRAGPLSVAIRIPPTALIAFALCFGLLSISVVFELIDVSEQPGDLLGAVNGRTFTADTPETSTLERSTQLIDHTFVKAQTDNAYPTATYTIAGNNVCAPAPPPTPTPTPKPKHSPH